MLAQRRGRGEAGAGGDLLDGLVGGLEQFASEVDTLGEQPALRRQANLGVEAPTERALAHARVPRHG